MVSPVKNSSSAVHNDSTETPPAGTVKTIDTPHGKMTVRINDHDGTIDLEIGGKKLHIKNNAKALGAVLNGKNVGIDFDGEQTLTIDGVKVDLSINNGLLTGLDILGLGGKLLHAFANFFSPSHRISKADWETYQKETAVSQMNDFTEEHQEMVRSQQVHDDILSLDNHRQAVLTDGKHLDTLKIESA